MGLRKVLPSIVVALVAVLAGIWTAGFPTIVDILLAVDKPDHSGLAKLRIGHLAAGGGETGTLFLAGAMKQSILAGLFGYTKPTASRQAWKELTKTLLDAERYYLSPAWGFGLDSPTDPTHGANEIAEGLLYVAHVTKLAMEVYLEEQPRMVRMLSPTMKLIGDNPNAQYYMASLHDGDDSDTADPKRKEFNVWGCRTPSEVYLSFAIHAKIPGKAFEKVVTDINDTDMNFDANGCYTLYLSPTFPGKQFLSALGHSRGQVAATWLETPLEATSLVSRHYFDTPLGSSNNNNKVLGGAISETVDVSVERYTSDGDASPRPAPLPVSDAIMASRIAMADDFIQRHTLLMPQPDPTTAPPFFSLVPNLIGRPQKWKHHAEGMGAVDIAYAAGRFLLEEGQALVLEGAVPPCRFANVVVWNRFLQTLDYTRPDEYPVSALLERPLEDGDSEPKPFRLVLSQTRPSGYTGTWIYTEGRPTGTVFFRFLLPEDEDEDGYPAITAKVVPIGDLDLNLAE